jgi:hypothetical protein
MLAIVAGGAFIIADLKPLGKGMILGTLFSIFNFILIAQSIPLRMDRSQKKTFFISLGSIFFRYALMAIPLIIAIKLEAFDLVGAIVGLFSIQLVILADHILTIILPTRAGQKHF